MTGGNMGKNKNRKPKTDNSAPQDTGGLDLSGLMSKMNGGGSWEQKDYSGYAPSRDRGNKRDKGGRDRENYSQGGSRQGSGQGGDYQGRGGQGGGYQGGYNRDRGGQGGRGGQSGGYQGRGGQAGGYRQGGYNQGRGSQGGYNPGRGGQGGRGQQNGIILDAEYVHAPFNFIPQWDIVQKIGTEDFTPHDRMDDGLYSGKIEYSIEALTPIFVGNGKEKEETDFVKNARGEYAIPGSSIRGLIRTNAQILGFAEFSEDVDDYSLMYRRVGGSARDEVNRRYKELLGDDTVTLPGGGTISVLKKVKAGYMCKIGNRYQIYGTSVDKIDTTSVDLGDMNYYIVGEKKILEEYRDYVNGGKQGDFAFDALILGKKNMLAHRPRWDDYRTRTRQIDPFRKIEKTGRGGRTITQYKGDKNKFYLPAFFPVSYELSSNKRHVIKVREPGKCSNEGYALLSGPMNDKKAVYIIPEIDRTKELFLMDPESGAYAEDIQSFRIDYKKRENTLVLRDYPDPDDAIKRKYKAFFDLPSEEKEIKPVFYFYNGGHVYFGFTPHLRLYFNHTIHDGLIHKDAKGYDIVKSLFGYARKKDSRKGKVYFSDAVAMNSPARGSITKVVLSEPKPTNYYTYLTHENGRVSTYNDEEYRLSGIKQYWPHDHIMAQDEVTNEKIKTSLRPLPEKTVFKGKVRFENLTGKELGLLLWSMKLEKDSCMNIGKGKPYGYGVIRLEIIGDETKLVKQEEAYDLSQGLTLSPFEPLAVDELIKSYKESAAELYGKQNADEVMAIPSVWAFFRMKDSTRILPDDKLKYMIMDEFKYQKQDNAVLPTVHELDAQLKGKK